MGELSDDYINWESIPKEFNYMTRDRDGKIILFSYKPEPAAKQPWWTICKGFSMSPLTSNLHIFESYIKGNKEWDKSLIRRPVVNSKAVQDNINPSHYKNHPAKCECGKSIECIQITEHMGFNLGNAVKYLWRCFLKGDPIVNLRKAIWYIEREIDRLTRVKQND